MADKTLFSDEIVQITEFKKHAKAYADRARERPLTIVQGGVADLALLPRELVAIALRRHEHLIQALDLLMHQANDTQLRFLTWADDLDDQERADFTAEYVSAIQRAEGLDTPQAWEAVNELVEDWAATAEALDNEELMNAVSSVAKEAGRAKA
jgi:hypothetical protein